MLTIMWKKVTLPLQGIFLKAALWILLLILLALPMVKCVPARTRTVFLNGEPVDAIKLQSEYYPPPVVKRKLPKNFYPVTEENYYYEPSFLEEDSMPFGPGDAVTSHKYSPPVDGHDTDLHRVIRHNHPIDIGMKSPSNHKEVYVPASPMDRGIEFSTTYSTPGDRRHTMVINRKAIVTEATVTSDYKVSNEQVFTIDSPKSDGNSSLNIPRRRNNFTDSNDSHVIVSSHTVLRYHPPPLELPNDVHSMNETKEHIDMVYTVPNSTQTENIFLSNYTTLNPVHDIDILLKDEPVDEDTETPWHVYNPPSTTENIMYYSTDNKVTFDPTANDTRENSSDTLPPIGSTKQYKFSSGAVAGIVIAVLTCVTILTSSVIYLLYRKYSGHCTSVVESKFNSDNCGYLDDSIRSSVYLNNHIELPKENSEEMTSLDNDSFLNSLETMTIQNYWADNTKNTKV